MKKSIFLISISLLFFAGCGMNELMVASQNGNISIMKQEIKKGTDINEEGPSNDTALYYAVRNNQFEAVKLLVESGANVNHRPKFYTPLAIASGNGNFQIVKYLVDHGADVNIRATKYDESTPLTHMVFHAWKDNKYKYYFSENHLKIVKYLVDHGANLSQLDVYNDAYYKEMTAAKNDLVQQYKQYINNLQEQKQLKMAQQIRENAIKQLEKKEKEDEAMVNKYIAQSNLKALKTYTDQNPNAVYYIKDNSIRLLFTGPKGLKIGDILKYKENGKSDVLLISLIKRVKTPYKEFTMDEIEQLQKMDLSDNVISALIDVTTELLKDEKRKKEQEFLLAEQKRIASQKQIIYKNNPNQNINTQNKNNPIVDKVTDELIHQGTKMLLDKLF